MRTNRYSVPVRLTGRTVRVMLHASEVVVYDGREEVTRHERLIAKGQSRLELDHCLEALVRKPGPFPGATALEQACSAGKFTPVHDAWWAAARKAHGDRDGTRALIEVLLLGRHLHHEYLVTGLAAALRAGALTSDAVALEARKAAEADDAPPAAADPEPDRARATFLTERRLAHLPTLVSGLLTSAHRRQSLTMGQPEQARHALPSRFSAAARLSPPRSPWARSNSFGSVRQRVGVGLCGNGKRGSDSL